MKKLALAVEVRAVSAASAQANEVAEMKVIPDRSPTSYGKVTDELRPPVARAAIRRLTYAEAARQIGSYLREQFDYGAVRGSLSARCRKTSRTGARCSIAFLDYDYDEWCRP